MHQPRETPGRVSILESTPTVEFDAERGVFRAAYDTGRDPTSLAVVGVVAAVGDRPPLDMPPLRAVVDTSALERLFSSGPDGARTPASVSFPYAGFRVTVKSGGTIEVRAAENT